MTCTLVARETWVKVDMGNLEMKAVSRGEFPLFSFLEFRFFWNSPNRAAIPILFGNPAWVAPLIAIPYMLAAFAYNFGGKKYFIREENEVAGIAILKVRQDALIVQSLAVSPVKRKRGIGFFVLGQVEMLAKDMKLPWLELEVLKSNITAQRLYWKFGFKICTEKRLTLVLMKRV